MNINEAFFNLENVFQSVSQDNELIEHALLDIKKRYSEKNRHYHNLDHILYMLNLLEPLKDEMSDFKTIVLAVWFHDVIYNPIRTDNEEQSSHYAHRTLRNLGFERKFVSQVESLILKTKEHKIGHKEEIDLQLFLDSDLAILGETPEKYEEYRIKVRKEFAIVPDFVYSRNRRKVLGAFLQQKRIYYSTLFYETHEKQARENMKLEIKNLRENS